MSGIPLTGTPVPLLCFKEEAENCELMVRDRVVTAVRFRISVVRSRKLRFRCVSRRKLRDEVRN